MTKEDLGGWLTFLLGEAGRLSFDDAEAEDLVSETVLRAMTFLDRGGEIVHPKSWLRQTMLHVRNDVLRKKYRLPVFVELTDELPVPSEDDVSRLWEPDEEEAVRREVNRLASEYRKAVILRYWRGLSVTEIASRLGIPEGTVKSRLNEGRRKIRKGLEQTMNQPTHMPGENEKIPETLLFSNAGAADSPGLLVEGAENLLAQNLLIEAYEKPLSLTELSRRTGVPTAYAEPIVRRLVDAQLMAETPGGLVYTDFIIFAPENADEGFDAQLRWATDHFDAVWPVLEGLREELERTGWWRTLSDGQRDKAYYHAALCSLQAFTGRKKGVDDNWRDYYRGSDPGWLGWGYRYPAGYDFEAKEKRDAYRILGGHRTSVSDSIPGVKSVATFEFDVTLLDRVDPPRYGLTKGGFRDYHLFKRLIWHLRQGEDPGEDRELTTLFLETIPKYIEYGLLARDPYGSLTADIPFIRNTEYNDLYERICGTDTVGRLDEAVGEEFRSFVLTRGVKIPPHLNSVPESLRYFEASNYIAMAILREAHARGLFLKDAPDPCPPVVAAYTE